MSVCRSATIACPAIVSGWKPSMTLDSALSGWIKSIDCQLRSSFVTVTNPKTRPAPDQVLVDIADYVCNFEPSPQPIDAARLCMLDTVGCAFNALDFPDCTKMLGPVVPGTVVPNASRVPGTIHELDPVTA